MNIKNFGIIGGDERQVAMKNSIALDGYNVFSFGLGEQNQNTSNSSSNLLEYTINNSDYILLPLPVTKDKKTIYAPLSDRAIQINEKLFHLLKYKNIFCGVKQSLIDANQKFKTLKIFDYSEREDFCIKNAVPTAEGAIQIAMQEYPRTIHGTHCLVAGFGRIGKVLCHMLKELGAIVNASARSSKDFALIETLGYSKICTDMICQSEEFDIIFNTIPYMVFDAYTLEKIAKHALIIDLASNPGGVDFEAAENLGINCIHALSLPGRVAPATAGEIIKSTVYNMIKEEFS